MASGTSSSAAQQATSNTASITKTIDVKLSPENYTEWKSLFSNYLGSSGFLGYVNGQLPSPSADEPFYTSWCYIDKYIRSCLFATLTEPLLDEVRDLPSAKAVWDALHARDVLGSRPGPRNIRRALSRHKLGTQSMNEYLRCIELLADQLKFVPAASPLSNDELVHYALEGLPQEYEAFITSIENGRGTVTFEELRPKLIHQENQLKEATYQEDHHQTPDSILETVTAQQKQEIAHGQQDEIDLLQASVSKYEVFLSFRGPDSRQCLADVLYRDMTAAGILAFRDNDALETGDKISTILPCIENSKICVPIFSETFAESAWCLREVERMVDLKKTIMPIFYKVTPDDVKLRTDLFKKGLRKHAEKYGKDQVKNWENALKEVGKIIGQEVKSTGLAEFSKSFVTKLIIKFKVNKKNVTDFVVQRDDEEQALMKLIDGNEARLVIGINGMGGVGKTTLAKVVFNRLSAGFDCSSFLENIQESIRSKGIESLQKQLLKDLDPKSKDLQMTDCMKMLREKFRNRKVLIILDDVNDREQVDTIVGTLDQFGSRSRIIITSRDRRVYTKEAQTFELQEMNQDQALQLFSRHAFRKDCPPSERKNLSDEVIRLTGQLPLALRIIGSRLYGYDDEKIWKETIEKLKHTLDHGVEKKLRISFDALDSQEKQIFLDIACFFIDEEMSRAMYMWEDCRLFPVLGIEVLLSMSLLKITKKDEALVSTSKTEGVFWMHDLVRDLGRAIVREKYPDEPAKWSRIWTHAKAMEALKIKKGKEEVKGLSLQLEWGEPTDLTSEELSSFSNLRFLKLRLTDLVGDFKHILLPQLRWFSWYGCRHDPEPTNLYAEKLVVLDLCESYDIWEGWTGWSLIQRANNLKVLDVTYCYRLDYMPDLSNNKALEILILRYCYRLIEMHSSIGELEKLKHLDLTGCSELESIPDLSNNENLERLDLMKCSNLAEIHSSIGELKRLKHLDLRGCYKLESIPDLSNNENLEILDLMDCSNLVEIHSSIGKLKRLKHLDLRGCSKLESIPDLSNNENLERLDLMECSNLVEIHSSIGKLKRLKHLDLTSCSKLESIPDLSNNENLERLDLMCCSNLVEIHSSIGKLEQLKYLNLAGCSKLHEGMGIPQSIGKLVNLTLLDLSGCIGVNVLLDTIGDLILLVKLDLSNTELSALPNTVGRLGKLQSLYLQKTKITELPYTIGDLKSLCEFDLSQTKVSVLPESIGQLDKLEKLCLDHTMIKELPNTFGHLASLKELSMHQTNLKELPDSFWALKSLEVLDLQESPLMVLPEKVGDLKSLRRLSLKSTTVKELPDSLGDLSNLQSLSMDSCKNISKLPRTIGKLTKLQEMHAVGCNSLTEIPQEIGNLSSLTSLSLTASHGSKIPPTINHLTSLKVLRILFHQDGVHGSGPASLTTCLYLGALTLLEELELDCSGFKCIMQLPSELEVLTLRRATSETKFPDFSNLKNLYLMVFRDCSLRDMDELESLREVQSLRLIYAENCTEELRVFCRQLRKGLPKYGN